MSCYSPVEVLEAAGNTGAVMAAGLFELRRIKGVDRPALSAVFPTRKGGALVIDVGANADCKPEHLAQFGLMGSVYMEKVFGEAIEQYHTEPIEVGECKYVHFVYSNHTDRHQKAKIGLTYRPVKDTGD